MAGNKKRKRKQGESSPYANTQQEPKKRGFAGYAIAGLLIAGATVAIVNMGGSDSGEAKVTVSVPDTFSDKGRTGQNIFNQTCAGCHGENAAGGDGGPPLIHKIYESGHHADGAIRNAVMLGVRQHHWSFGNMPPQPSFTGADIDAITAFLRETQRANGIF